MPRDDVTAIAIDALRETGRYEHLVVPSRTLQLPVGEIRVFKFASYPSKRCAVYVRDGDAYLISSECTLESFVNFERMLRESNILADPEALADAVDYAPHYPRVVQDSETAEVINADGPLFDWAPPTMTREGWEGFVRFAFSEDVERWQIDHAGSLTRTLIFEGK